MIFSLDYKFGKIILKEKLRFRFFIFNLYKYKYFIFSSKSGELWGWFNKYCFIVSFFSVERRELLGNDVEGLI